MGDTSSRHPDVGVVVDPTVRGRDPRDAWDTRRLPVATIDELEQGTACRAVETDARLIVLDGDDRLVSRAVTAYQRRHRGRPAPLELLPLEVGRFCRVAREVGGPRPTDRFAERLAAGEIRSQTTAMHRRALRVTSSALPAPVWGFSAGSGLVYRLFEMLLRSEGGGFSGLRSVVAQFADGLAGGERRFDTVGARISVDYRPEGDDLGYLVASGLERSWLGLRAASDQRPGWQGSDSAGELVRAVAGAATLPDFLGRTGGAEFRRIHIDGPGGFVVDGELYEPDAAHVLQIAPGPEWTFAGLS